MIVAGAGGLLALAGGLIAVRGRGTTAERLLPAILGVVAGVMLVIDYQDLAGMSTRPPSSSPPARRRLGSPRSVSASGSASSVSCSRSPRRSSRRGSGPRSRVTGGRRAPPQRRDHPREAAAHARILLRLRGRRPGTLERRGGPRAAGLPAVRRDRRDRPRRCRPAATRAQRLRARRRARARSGGPRFGQQQLETIGWRFARIWSPDWFRDRPGEIERIKAAYRGALDADVPPRVVHADPPGAMAFDAEQDALETRPMGRLSMPRLYRDDSVTEVPG